MTVKIEAGKITEDNSICMFTRNIHIDDGKEQRTLRIDAETRDELEIVDHENFMKEKI